MKQTMIVLMIVFGVLACQGQDTGQVKPKETQTKISIEGHTDNVGDAVSNKTLSNNRAKTILDALIAKGIDITRLSFIGWGQEKPVADNRTEEGKTKNRRVEIVKKP